MLLPETRNISADVARVWDAEYGSCRYAGEAHVGFAAEVVAEVKRRPGIGASP